MHDLSDKCFALHKRKITIPSLVFVPCALWMRCLPQIKIMIIDLERETVRTQYVKKIYQHA